MEKSRKVLTFMDVLRYSDSGLQVKLLASPLRGKGAFKRKC